MIAVIQLDGLGAEPLERLLEAGAMPNLAAFLARTPPTPATTPAPLFPASVYPTLYSGLEPAEHGLFYPFQWHAAEQRVTVAESLPQPRRIWEELGARGLRSLVIDPYECPPTPAPGARVISGWQLGERVVLRAWSRPRSLWPSAAVRQGLPPRATEIFGEHGEREIAALGRRLERSPGRVADLVERELFRERFDLAWVSFIAPHIAGHRLWGRPELDAVYRATDVALGRVLAALPAGALPLLVCPIGMTRDQTASDLLPEMLARVLGGVNGSADGGQEDGGAIWRLRSAIPPRVRYAVAAGLPGALMRGLTARLELRGVDWSHTRAFAHPSDNQGYVRFNLRGREREGVVAPDDAEALCAEITEGLESFTRPSGAPAIESIQAPSDPGPRADQLPDLVVRWAHGEEGLERVQSERFGTVQRHGAGSGRTGNHPDDGAWVAAEGIDAGDGGAFRLSELAGRIAAWSGIDAAPEDGQSVEQVTTTA